MAAPHNSGFLSLITVALPNKSLQYTNRVYVNEEDLAAMQNAVSGSASSSGHVLINSGLLPVFAVEGNPSIDRGQIAMSSTQRTASGVGPGERVSCKLWGEAHSPDLQAVTIVLELEYKLTKKSAVVKEDDMLKTLKRYQNQVMVRGQEFIVDHRSYPFFARVTQIESMQDGELEHTERGMWTSSTVVATTAVEHKKLEYKRSKSMRSTVIKAGWRFEDMGIGGLGDEFQKIFRRAFASRLFPPTVIQALGLTHVRGLLLFGPPGTGKTLIARQIGKLLHGREPKVVNGPEILNKYVGQSEENIRELFQEAEEDLAKNGENADLHIIIFDELDAICKQRGSVRSGTGVHDTVVNQLLSKIDGVNSLPNILVIGMTNRKELLDDALLRPGRLEVHVEIGLPDQNGRQEILSIHTRAMRENRKLAADVDLLDISERTKNFSGAELAGLVRTAQSRSLFKYINPKTGAIDPKVDLNTVKVTHEDFLGALEECEPAFGVAEEELSTCLRGGLIEYGPAFTTCLSTVESLVHQVRDSDTTSLLSVLLVGPDGCGKTAVAAKLAMDSDFPFVKLITPDDFVGYGEHAKVQAINNVFENAYKSPLSLIILDNMERLLEYVPIGPRFSNPVLQAIAVLLKKQPRHDNRKLMIIGTTSFPEILDDMQITSSFNVTVPVPMLTAPSEVRHVLSEMKVTVSEAELKRIVQGCPFPIAIKQLMLVIELMKNDADSITYETFQDSLAACGLLRTDSALASVGL